MELNRRKKYNYVLIKKAQANVLRQSASISISKCIRISDIACDFAGLFKDYIKTYS